MHDLVVVMTVTAMLGLLTFVVLYAVRSPWRSTRTGRAVMGFKVTIMLAGLTALGEETFGESPNWDVPWIFVLLVINLAVIYLIWALLKAQRREREDYDTAQRLNNDVV